MVSKKKGGDMKIENMTFDQKFEFGKHKGKQLDYVMGVDLSYITWLLDSKIITLNKKAQSVYNVLIGE